MSRAGNAHRFASNQEPLPEPVHQCKNCHVTFAHQYLLDLHLSYKANVECLIHENDWRADEELDPFIPEMLFCQFEDCATATTSRPVFGPLGAIVEHYSFVHKGTKAPDSFHASRLPARFCGHLQSLGLMSEGDEAEDFGDSPFEGIDEDTCLQLEQSAGQARENEYDGGASGSVCSCACELLSVEVCILP